MHHVILHDITCFLWQFLLKINTLVVYHSHSIFVTWFSRIQQSVLEFLHQIVALEDLVLFQLEPHGTVSVTEASSYFQFSTVSECLVA